MVLLGWVHRVRDLGGVLFVDVRDRSGVSQVVFDADDEATLAKAKRLRSEFVVGVSGVVRRRSDETVNPKLESGDVEVVVRQLTLLNEAKTPPFQVAEDSPVSEEVRLKYRYLDLRRPRLQANIGLRHKLTTTIAVPRIQRDRERWGHGPRLRREAGGRLLAQRSGRHRG